MSLQELRTLIDNLHARPIVNKTSPASHPRRAGVAAILRWKYDTGSTMNKLDVSALPTTGGSSSILASFMNQMKSQPGELELMFIQRAKRPGDMFSGQVAFPGGKSEENETDLDTAMREVDEEVGLDLGGPDFLHLGKLDDITITSVGDKFMMILVPFVFLQLAPKTPPLTIQPGEVAAVHWVRLQYLLSTPTTNYDPFATHIPDKQRLLEDPRPGVVQVPSITLPTSTIPNKVEQNEPVILWGITLRITQQLITFASNQLQHDSNVIAYNNQTNTVIKSRL
ncbi:NUDIX hydrolase domain-like protein [Chlamydoabsidia padenii]|nr:NUDIX hydrolase domain-like protein [Chlamydoabsidia padenii]